MEKNSNMTDALGDEAVILAKEGRWEEAVLLNQRIIEQSPSNVNALNRLGKSLSELGKHIEAMEAYNQAASIDPNNIIAKKNLIRLSNIQSDDQSLREGKSIDSTFFIEETSKSRIVNLHRVAEKHILAKMSEGDEVFLELQGGKTVIVNNSKEYLGEVDPQIGMRLVDRLLGGNEYQAAIVRLLEQEVNVIIRETYQHPSQLGHPSFPRKTVVELKPYLKSTILKYELDDDLSEEVE